MFCTKCGAAIPDSAKFCTSCGAPVAAKPAAPVQPPVQPEQPKAAPAPAPVQPAAQPQPRPAPAPVQPVTPVPAAAPAKPKGRLSGGAIALIVTLCVVAVAALAAALVLFLSPGDSPADSGAELPAPGLPGFALPDGGESSALPDDFGFSAAPAEPAHSAYDTSVMDGIYYCAQEQGAVLELYTNGDQLSITKTGGSSEEIFTLISAPDGPGFTIDYGGRLIEFYYSEAGQSVTLSELGRSQIFTLDGYEGWTPSYDEAEFGAMGYGYDPFADPNGYILPTDSRYIDETDLYPYSEEEVKLIRNEIYARHGYSFTMDKFRDYFAGKSWYQELPSVNVNTFGTEQMNEYERANLDLIKKYEEAMGW